MDFKPNTLLNEKKRRKAFTLEEKVFFIRLVQNNVKSPKQICQEFNVFSTTLAGILKNKETYLSHYENNLDSGSKVRLRKVKFTEIDKPIADWCRTQPIMPSQAQIFQVANNLASDLNIKDFKPTRAWLMRFQKSSSLNSQGNQSISDEMKMDVDVDNECDVMCNMNEHKPVYIAEPVREAMNSFEISNERKKRNNIILNFSKIHDFLK